jgi:hypothetical protein
MLHNFCQKLDIFNIIIYQRKREGRKDGRKKGRKEGRKRQDERRKKISL